MVSVVTWICTSQCEGRRVDTGLGTAAIRPGELVHVRGNTMNPGRRDDLGKEQIFINNNERRLQNNMVIRTRPDHASRQQHVNQLLPAKP